jgi:hypothetical protein
MLPSGFDQEGRCGRVRRLTTFSESASLLLGIIDGVAVWLAGYVRMDRPFQFGSFFVVALVGSFLARSSHYSSDVTSAVLGVFMAPPSAAETRRRA